jgi:tetratricopeptide (TPR) repeat protein
MNIRSILENASCFIVVLILSFICLTNAVSAETKTFIKEYTYQASDEDSKISSRTIALREVKRLLLVELGTYLESQTEVKNFKLTKDQIVTLTAGIVQTELIDEKWNTGNFKYWLKAKITANPQDVIKSIDSLRKERAKVKELEELRKKSEELLKENKRLTKKLKTATGNAKQEAVQAYKRNIDNLSATEWIEKGYKLAESGNNTDAEKAFSKAIELNPQFAMAYYNRGKAYYNNGNTQQAIKDYDKSIELNPQDTDAYNNRGIAYHNIGNTQQEVEDFNKAIELNPQDAISYYNRGIAYHKRGNTQQAIKDYSKAIELNPRLAEAYNNRGVAHHKLGNIQRAIENFKIAARLGNKGAQDFLTDQGIDWMPKGNPITTNSDKRTQNSGKNAESSSSAMRLDKIQLEPAPKHVEDATDSEHPYKGIKGIELMNGNIIEGQIISFTTETVNIRTKDGKILSYSLKKEVRSITSE